MCFSFCQALHKDDIVALKSQLQRIKKHAEKISRPAPVSSSSKSSSPGDDPTPTAPKTTTPPNNLKLTVARAKNLADKAQKRLDEREAETSRQSEAQNQDK